jgi:hypothetical protein
MDILKLGTVALVALSLGACASRTSPMSPTEDLAPAEPIATQPEESMQPAEPLPTGPLTAKQISNALKEKSFNYAAGSRKGTITYFADGTTSYTETGKGEGTGLWQASDGKLCEARNPTKFLPKGTPSICSAFSGTGSSYTAGSMKLTPA